jgi:hypothetical protein
MVTRTLVPAVVATLLLAGCAAEPAAQGSNEEKAYFQYVHINIPYYANYSNPNIRKVGKLICETLIDPNSVVPWDDDVATLSKGMPSTEAGEFMAASVKAYCPDQLSKVPVQFR